MKTKRFLSVLLALILCLGLLPSTTLAEGEGTASIGLKLTTDVAGEVPISANQDRSYTVNISEGANTIVYVQITGDDTAVFAEDAEFKVTVGPGIEIVSSELLENNTVMKITHYGDKDSATMPNNGRTLTAGGQEFTLTINFVNADSGSGDENEEDDSNGTTLESGVYTTLTDGVLSNPIAGVRYVDGSFGYSINYTTGAETTVYYYSTETVTNASADDRVSVVAHETLENVYVITLASGCSGKVLGDIKVGNGGYPLVFSDRPFALFNNSNNEYMANNDGSYTITCSVVDGRVEGETVYFSLNDSTASFGNCVALLNIPDGPSLISGKKESNDNVFAVTFIGGTSNASTEVSLTVGETEYKFDITFTGGTENDDGNESGTGGNQDGDQGGNGIKYTLVTESRNITADDKIDKEEAEKIVVGPAEFKYDANGDDILETYYINAMGGAVEGEYHMAISGGSGQTKAPFWSDCSVGIWTYNSSGNKFETK